MSSRRPAAAPDESASVVLAFAGLRGLGSPIGRDAPRALAVPLGLCSPIARDAPRALEQSAANAANAANASRRGRAALREPDDGVGLKTALQEARRLCSSIGRDAPRALAVPRALVPRAAPTEMLCAAGKAHENAAGLRLLRHEARKHGTDGDLSSRSMAAPMLGFRFSPMWTELVSGPANDHADASAFLLAVMSDAYVRRPSFTGLFSNVTVEAHVNTYLATRELQNNIYRDGYGDVHGAEYGAQDGLEHVLREGWSEYDEYMVKMGDIDLSSVVSTMEYNDEDDKAARSTLVDDRQQRLLNRTSVNRKNAPPTIEAFEKMIDDAGVPKETWIERLLEFVTYVLMPPARMINSLNPDAEHFKANLTKTLIRFGNTEGWFEDRATTVSKVELLVPLIDRMMHDLGGRNDYNTAYTPEYLKTGFNDLQQRLINWEMPHVTAVEQYFDGSSSSAKVSTTSRVVHRLIQEMGSYSDPAQNLEELKKNLVRLYPARKGLQGRDMVSTHLIDDVVMDLHDRLDELLGDNEEYWSHAELPVTANTAAGGELYERLIQTGYAFLATATCKPQEGPLLSQAAFNMFVDDAHRRGDNPGFTLQQHMKELEKEVSTAVDAYFAATFISTSSPPYNAVVASSSAGGVIRALLSHLPSVHLIETHHPVEITEREPAYRYDFNNSSYSRTTHAKDEAQDLQHVVLHITDPFANSTFPDELDAFLPTTRSVRLSMITVHIRSPAEDNSWLRDGKELGAKRPEGYEIAIVFARNSAQVFPVDSWQKWFRTFESSTFQTNEMDGMLKKTRWNLPMLSEASRELSGAPYALPGADFCTILDPTAMNSPSAEELMLQQPDNVWIHQLFGERATGPRDRAPKESPELKDDTYKPTCYLSSITTVWIASPQGAESAALPTKIVQKKQANMRLQNLTGGRNEEWFSEEAAREELMSLHLPDDGDEETMYKRLIAYYESMVTREEGYGPSHPEDVGRSKRACSKTRGVDLNCYEERFE